MVAAARRAGAVRDERGFTLVEMLIAAAITAVAIGAATALSNTVQYVYSYQLDDAAVQQEARFALNWIERTIATAGSNPYGVAVSACPAANTAFAAIQLDPDADGVHDDIRVHADVNPPNGVLLGLTGACTAALGGESGEDVTIAHNPATLTLTRHDRAIDTSGPVAVTDGVFSQLRFTYLSSTRAATAVATAVAYVQVSLTGQSQARNPYTGGQATFTYTTEIRVRGR